MCQLLGWFGLGDFGLTFGVLVHENEKLFVLTSSDGKLND
jgi:hypothetical protein